MGHAASHGAETLFSSIATLCAFVLLSFWRTSCRLGRALNDRADGDQMQRWRPLLEGISLHRLGAAVVRHKRVFAVAPFRQGENNNVRGDWRRPCHDFRLLDERRIVVLLEM